MIRGLQMPGFEFGQDTGVSTPSLAVCNMVSDHSQDLGLTSYPKDKSPNYRGAIGPWGCSIGQSYEPPQLVSHPRIDQDQPC